MNIAAVVNVAALVVTVTGVVAVVNVAAVATYYVTPVVIVVSLVAYAAADVTIAVAGNLVAAAMTIFVAAAGVTVFASLVAIVTIVDVTVRGFLRFFLMLYFPLFWSSFAYFLRMVLCHVSNTRVQFWEQQETFVTLVERPWTHHSILHSWVSFPGPSKYKKTKYDVCLLE